MVPPPGEALSAAAFGAAENAGSPERALGNWDRVAEEYLAEYCHELRTDHTQRELLRRFTVLAKQHPGRVMDLGCGPGHVTAHLHLADLPVTGLDLSPAMIHLARRTHPEVDFQVGDLTRLQVPPGSLAGVLLYYSLVNLARQDVTPLLRRLRTALAPGAPLLIATHAGDGVHHSPSLFGTDVNMSITLYTQQEMSGYLTGGGLQLLDAGTASDSKTNTAPFYTLACSLW